MLSLLKRTVSSTSPPPDPEEALNLLQKELESLNPALSDEDRAFLSKPCLLRYLQARNFHVAKSKQMLLNTLSWRKTYGTSTLYIDHSESLRSESSSGKMYVLPPTHSGGSAVIIMRPGLENSRDAEANVRYLVYTLERAAKVTEDGKFIVVVDYLKGKVTASNMPSFAVTKQTVNILQNHYPERLRAAFLVDAPGFVNGLLKAVRPFLDPITREKVCLVKSADMREREECKRVVDFRNMPREYGGEIDFEFGVEKYFEEFEDC